LKLLDTTGSLVGVIFVGFVIIIVYASLESGTNSAL
jgi:hypothetical protein